MKQIFNFFETVVVSICGLIISTVAILVTVGLPIILIFGIPILFFILLIKVIIKL